MSDLSKRAAALLAKASPRPWPPVRFVPASIVGEATRERLQWLDDENERDAADLELQGMAADLAEALIEAEAEIERLRGNAEAERDLGYFVNHGRAR